MGNRSAFAHLVVSILVLCGYSCPLHAQTGQGGPDYVGELERLESELQKDGPRDLEAVAHRLQPLRQKLGAEGLSDLEARAAVLQAVVAQLEHERIVDQRLETARAQTAAARAERLKLERLRRGRRTSLVVLGVSAVLFNTFWYLGEARYDRYTNSSSSREREELRGDIRLLDNLTAAGGALAVVSLTAAVSLRIAEGRAEERLGTHLE